MSSAMIPSSSKSGGTVPLISAVASAWMSPGLRVRPDPRELAHHVVAHGEPARLHAGHVGRVGRGVDRGVDRLDVDVPVLQRDPEHPQGEHGGHDVGQVVDEVDPAGLDLLVQAGADELVHQRRPPGHRGRRQVRVEQLPVVPLLGRVHLQEAAAERHLRGRDRDALVAPPLVVRVVVVGHVLGRPGQLEDLGVPGGDPVAAVGVAPRDRALVQHLRGDVGELLPVLGRVPVEVVAVLLPPVSSSVTGSVLMRVPPARLGDDRDCLFRTRADRLGRLGLQVGRDLAVDGGGVAVLVVQREQGGGDHGAERVPLAPLRVDAHLHVRFPFFFSPNERGLTARRRPLSVRRGSRTT